MEMKIIERNKNFRISCNGSQHFTMDLRRCVASKSQCTCLKGIEDHSCYESTTPAWMESHVGD